MDENTPTSAPRHQSVLPVEVLDLLALEPSAIVVDATVGVGGHSRLLLEKLGESGRLIGLDQDPTMLALARPKLTDPRVTFIHANFESLTEVLQELQIEGVDAILADLGFCSDQLANSLRGFSFQHDGPLDMRLDPKRGDPASTLVRRLREQDLADLFWQFGEERFSRRIARKISETRQNAPLETTARLADLVRSCVPRAKHHSIDPATRVFQALRIAVNDELGALERFLAQLSRCLKPGGKAAIISFHSLEDRMVKHAFRNKDVWEPVTKKAVQASEEEIARNPRARSAKLRVARLMKT